MCFNGYKRSVSFRPADTTAPLAIRKGKQTGTANAFYAAAARAVSDRARPSMKASKS